MRMSLMRHPCVSFGGKTLLDGLSDLLDGCVLTEFFYLLVLHNFPQSECVGDLALHAENRGDLLFGEQQDLQHEVIPLVGAAAGAGLAHEDEAAEQDRLEGKNG